jgi:single-stranded DNA-binding protein
MLRASTFRRAFSTTPARANLAKFTGIGRIGTDLATQEASSGRTYLRYPLAVSGPKDNTSWYNIVVFDEHAIKFMTNYLKKG